MSEPSGLSKRLLLLGRLAATVLIAAYVYRTINWRTLSDTLRATRPLLLACAGVLQGCSLAAVVTRWRMLLREQGIDVGWSTAGRLSLIGLYFNLLLPGSIGGDASRFLGTLQHAPNQKHRLALSLLQDRVMGLGALLLLLGAFLVFHGPDFGGNRALHSVAVGVLVGCVAFVLLAGASWLLRRAVATGADGGRTRWTVRVGRALCSVIPGRSFLPVLALSLANHALFIAMGCVAAHAVGIPIAYADAAIVFCVTALVLSLPITIAGLGVRDGMLIWMLSAFGFRNAGAAVGLSACMLGIALVWALMGGLAFYLPARHD